MNIAADISIVTAETNNRKMNVPQLAPKKVRIALIVLKFKKKKQIYKSMETFQTQKC